MSDRHPLWVLLDRMQMDLRQMQARMVELRAQVSGIGLPDGRPECPVCGYRSAMNLPSVADHMQAAHGEIEERAA